MRKWIVRIVVVGVIVLAAIGLRQTVFAPKPIVVETVAVERGLVESAITNSKAGTVKARRRARLSPEIGGRVVELPFREGDRVAIGDILVRLDASTQLAEREKARRDVVTVEAEKVRACLAADQANREYQRNLKLRHDRIVSEDLLERLQSDAEAAAAACDAATASIASAKAVSGVIEAELQKTVLTAPFDGVLAELEVELGEWVTPSPPGLLIPPVAEIIDTRSIYVSAPMDEVDSAAIARGQRARITLDPYPDRSFDGTVVRVAPYVLDIEAQNRTIEVEVELTDAVFAHTLLPGTTADVEIILDEHRDALRVPTPALVAGNTVLTIENSVLVERVLTVGLKNWDYTEVLDGLAEGERVVTNLDQPEVVAGAEASIAGPATGRAP